MRNGGGAKEYHTIASFLGLPISKHFSSNYSQMINADVYNKIINAGKMSVHSALKEEVKLTYLSQNPNGTFEEWMNKDTKERYYAY